MSERTEKLLFKLVLGLWVLFGIIAFAAAARADTPPSPREFVLFGGNTDSTEQVSQWIPIKDASMVIIKTWSTHAAFTASGPDSLFTDSIAVFKVAFGDSVSGTTGHYPVIQDSTVITTTAFANIDTSTAMVAVFAPPLQEALRHASNGSGIITYVYPLVANYGTTAAINLKTDGIMNKKYMRVLITPTRRLTANTSTCDGACGKRTNGLKGLKMTARVYSRWN